MRNFVIALASLLMLGFAGVANASERGTPDDATAMVARVQALFEAKGEEETFAAIMDKANTDFHDRDLYAFVYTLDGVAIAHGAKPQLVGKNLSGLKDQTGKEIIKEMIATTKDGGSGWVDYKWPNPTTNAIEDKTSYVELLGGKYFVGVGIYK